MRINEITNYGAVPKGVDQISVKDRINTKTTTSNQGRSTQKISTSNIRNTQNTGTTDFFKRTVSNKNPDGTTNRRITKTTVDPDNSYYTTIQKTDSQGNKTATRTRGYDSIFKHRPKTLKMN